jgi:hypothetical protein
VELVLNDKVFTLEQNKTKEINVLGSNKDFIIDNFSGTTTGITGITLTKYGTQTRKIEADDFGLPYDLSDVNLTITTASVAYTGGSFVSGTEYQHDYSWAINYRAFQALGYYDDGDKYPPDNREWTYDSDVTVSGVVYPKYLRKLDIPNDFSFEVGKIKYEYTAGSFIYSYLFVTSPDKASLTITNTLTQYTTFERAFDFYTAVQKVVQNIDSTILFDSTGTTTDSFYFLKNYTGESLTFGSTTTTKCFEYLSLVQITDIILESDNMQKDQPATIGMLTFEKIINFFENIGIYYYLENRTGTYYFVTKHFTEFSSSSSGS